jgi:hypothetical protein
MTLLEALSPTTAALLNPDVHFFSITYTFNAPLLGELQNSAVIYGVDEQAALASFRSKNPKVTRAWVSKEKTESGKAESGIAGGGAATLKGAAL